MMVMGLTSYMQPTVAKQVWGWWPLWWWDHKHGSFWVSTWHACNASSNTVKRDVKAKDDGWGWESVIRMVGLPGITSHLCAAPIHRITALIHIWPRQRFTFILHKFWMGSRRLNDSPQTGQRIFSRIDNLLFISWNYEWQINVMPIVH